MEALPSSAFFLCSPEGHQGSSGLCSCWGFQGTVFSLGFSSVYKKPPAFLVHGSSLKPAAQNPPPSAQASVLSPTTYPSLAPTVLPPFPLLRIPVMALGLPRRAGRFPRPKSLD